MQLKFLSLSLSGLLVFSGMVFADGRTAEEHHAAALDKDAETISRMYRISPADARRRLKLQEAASERLVGQIKTEFKDRFAGSYIEHDPIDRMVVRLKGDEQVANRELEVGGDVLLVEFITGQSHTRAELQEILNKNTPRLKEAIEGLDGTFVDEKTGKVVLVVYMKETDEAKIERSKEIGEEILGVSVRISITPAQFKETLGTVRGGGFLSSGCTSGFVVKKIDTSIRGVITAGHCPSGSTVYSDWIENGTLLMQQESVYTPSEDVKWYKAMSFYPWSTYMEPTFYADSMWYTRTLTGKQTWMNTQPGQNICQRGKTTGYSCGTVESVAFKHVQCGVPTCAATWISVIPNQDVEPRLACYGGDSGGPWFIGSKAVGITKGSNSIGMGIGECIRVAFMSIDRINVLGVELVYGP